MRIEPGQRFHDSSSHQAKRAMRPGANREEWAFARLAQETVVVYLPGQEDVIPAPHEIDGRLDLFDGLVKGAPLPVVAVGLWMVQPLLKEGVSTNGELIQIAQGQVGKERVQFAPG